MRNRIRPSQEDRIAVRRAAKGPGRRWLGVFANWGAVGAIWLAVVVGGVIAWYAADLPDIDQALTPTRKPTVTMLADDGSVLATLGDDRAIRATYVAGTLAHARLSVDP